MKRALFVCMDGPKGTGKTTVLEAVTRTLRADGLKVIRLCESKLDPYRGETMALVNRMARAPTEVLELDICQRLAHSRAWISRHVLATQPTDSVMLIDRWYPSDAAFRRAVPFAQALQLNLSQSVQVPDLHVGLITDPHVSWARAAARSRGLGSTVLRTFEAHVASTQAFERAFEQQGWGLYRNDGALEDTVRAVAAAIHSAASKQVERA